jgi:hypothetical protein
MAIEVSRFILPSSQKHLYQEPVFSLLLLNILLLRRSLSSSLFFCCRCKLILSVKLCVRRDLREQTSEPPRLRDPARDRRVVRFWVSVWLRDCLLYDYFLLHREDHRRTTTFDYIQKAMSTFDYIQIAVRLLHATFTKSSFGELCTATTKFNYFK